VDQELLFGPRHPVDGNGSCTGDLISLINQTSNYGLKKRLLIIVHFRL
jgi:hypothetical protein